MHGCNGHHRGGQRRTRHSDRGDPCSVRSLARYLRCAARPKASIINGAAIPRSDISHRSTMSAGIKPEGRSRRRPPCRRARDVKDTPFGRPQDGAFLVNASSGVPGRWSRWCRGASCAPRPGNGRRTADGRGAVRLDLHAPVRRHRPRVRERVPDETTILISVIGANPCCTAAPNRASAGSRGLFRLRPNTLSTGLY
jgi:hypothetical protein